MPFFTTANKSNKSTTSPATAPTKKTVTTIAADKATTTSASATTANPNASDTMVTDPSKVSAVPVEHKDVREFEHGRQKAKKTARTQNWREDKAHRRRVKTGEAVSVSAPPQPAKRGARGTYRESGVRPDWEEGWSAEDAHDEFLHDAMEEWEHGEGAGRIVRSESGKLEVDLTNLMKPAKARRGKRAMGDFEVLPSVRQVVALEDRLEDELELDEPWEHLSANGDDEKPFSYAEIAATAC